MKKHEYTSAAVASKAGAMLGQQQAMLNVLDEFRRVLRRQMKDLKSIAGSALTQYQPRSK